MLNYEDEIEEKVIQALKFKFNINKNEVLYKYLRLRNKCINSKKNKKYEKEEDLFVSFIISELHINNLLYKQQKISLLDGFDNSLKNIVENWFLKYSLIPSKDENGNNIDIDNYIKNSLESINEYSKKKIKGIKSAYISEISTFYKLEKLNYMFNVNKLNEAPIMEGFSYNNDIYEQTPLEYQLNSYIHSSNFETSSLYSITEENLESYIFRHLEYIEEGLKPVERQVEIEEGRIDILARDKNGEYVILELKISNDKHLIWQVIYYPDAIKEKYKCENVRIITVCPSYPNYILNPLKKIGYVELIEYKLQISNSKIEKSKFFKKQ